MLRSLFTKERWPVTVGYLIIGLFVFLRLWRLSLPMEAVFDEVYFPKMASQYLAGEQFFDIHPPLGKLIIAIGELLFGNVTLGWRIMPALAGLAMLPVGYWASYQLTQNKVAAFLFTLWLSLDGLFIVYSRTGLMDGFMILFGLAAIGFAWQFYNQRQTGQQAWLALLLTGTMAGLALAIKWIGGGFLPLVALMTLLTLWLTKKPKFSLIDGLIWLIAFLLIPALLYILPFLANWQTDFWANFALWHQQSWNYNIHLNATHPYASKWWSWPFLIRPIWFYYKDIQGQITGVDAIGNPLLWWSSTLAVVYSIMILTYSIVVWRRPQDQLIDKKDFYRLLFMVGGWAAFYLPWVRIGRVLFLYHYFASYLFALILTAFWLSRLWANRQSRAVLFLIVGLIFVTALAFVPIWIASPIDRSWFKQLMWFKSWI